VRRRRSRGACDDAEAEGDPREQLAGERGRPLVQDEPEREGYRQMHAGVLPERL